MAGSQLLAVVIASMSPAPKHARRWLGAALAMLVLCAVGLRWARRKEPFPDPNKRITAVEIVLFNQNSPIKVRIIEPSRIESLAAKLQASRPIRWPTKYERLGEMTIFYSDGGVDQADTYLPWGNYKKDATYRMADFSLLRDEARRETDRIGFEGTSKFNNPNYWK